jgi:hypothetical protein
MGQAIIIRFSRERGLSIADEQTPMNGNEGCINEQHDEYDSQFRYVSGLQYCLL